ncbi:MAG: proton-conducting transporter membrane subunit, partial [Chloroflexota bacterium]
MVNILFIVLALSITAIFLFSTKVKGIAAVTGLVAIAVITGIRAIQSLIGPAYSIVLKGPSMLGDIPVRIDALSAWFILIINFTVVTGAIYGTGYLKKEIQSRVITSHWILYSLFHASMLMVCMIQNGIAFIVAWEIMSLSSFLLVLFDYTNPKVIKAGVNYLVQMHISVVLLTVAFIWVYFKTGTFDFQGISTFFGSNVNMWLFLLFFAGFGIKSGFIGFHTWLPMAHPAAPSHISGVMSGVIVKMGIYGILRVLFFLKSDFVLLGEIVLIVSVLTGLFGIMNAAVHRDFKKMLAYCTIENIGIIGIGLGVGLIGWGSGHNLMVFLGFGGALLHVLNHSLFKSLLFFSAGSVYRQTHTRDMDRLGGLLKTMPKTGALFLIGSIAIGGIPPLNGFVSEFLIYCGLLNGINAPEVARVILMIVAFAGMSLIGGISILAFSKTFGIIFLGNPRNDTGKDSTEVSGSMLIPQYFIVIAMIAIGMFPGFFAGLA